MDKGMIRTTLATASEMLPAGLLEHVQTMTIVKKFDIPNRIQQVASKIDETLDKTLTQAKQYKVVVDAAWFKQVEAVVSWKDAFLAAANTVFVALQDKEKKSEFIAGLQAKLSTVWVSSMVVPASAYYSVALEYFNQAKSKCSDSLESIKELQGEVKAKLGSVWQTQVQTAFESAGTPVITVYNSLVKAYADLPKDVPSVEWVNAAKVYVGAYWDEKLNPLVHTWLEGAKASSAVTFISSMSSLSATELFSYVYQSSLVVAKNGVDYLLPADSASTSSEDLSMGYLMNTTASRLNEKIQTNIDALKLHQVDLLNYAKAVLDTAKSAVEKSASSEKLNALLSQGSEALNNLREIVANHALTIKAESSTSALLRTYALVKSGSASLVSQLYEAPSSLPRASLVFLAQGLGLQDKDAGFEAAVENLQALMTSLKQIVQLAPESNVESKLAVVGEVEPTQVDDTAIGEVKSDPVSL